MTKQRKKQRGAPPKRRTTNSFRKEIVDLHREIFRRNKKRINDSVYGYTNLFKQYEEMTKKDTLFAKQKKTRKKKVK